MSDLLELAAWRFLAAHRVDSLAVTHVTFIDDGANRRMNTPSFDGFYESAKGSTFGEAAIELAIALGMPCEENASSDSTKSDCGQASSSASTATRRSGESAKTSRRTRSALAVSTTAATSAAAPIAEPAKRTSTAVKVSVAQSFCGCQAVEEARAGNNEDAAEWRWIVELIGEIE